MKVDRVFVRDVESDDTARDLLRCMIEAGHALDLLVTAEGIETRGQYEILRDLQCDVGQGFLFARPMPVDDLRGWLRAPNWSDGGMAN